MDLRKIGKAVAGEMESTAKRRARELKGSQLGDEYERFAEGMEAFKNSPMLNPRNSSNDEEDEW